MIIRLNELHSLIIYIVFGYAILLPLVLITLRIFDISGPVQRLRIYLVAFLTPVAAFVLYHTVLVKRCESGITPLWSESLFHLLCLVSDGMLIVFVPLFGVLTSLALLKAVASSLMIKRLEKRTVLVGQDQAKTINKIILNKSQELGLYPPRVLVVQRDDFAAFTTGFIKPVIVISYRIVRLLEERELEAVISHELVHIKHRDTLKNWLLHLVRDITLLNPLNILLLKGYLLEKEIICDQKAAELANQEPQEYAATLLKVWRSLIDRPGPKLAVISSFTGSNGMERRIEFLLKNSETGGKSSDYIAIFSSILLFSVTIIFLGIVC